MEYLNPTHAAELALTGALGMGHHAEHTAAFVADAGDVLQGPIRVGPRRDFTLGSAVAKDDSLLAAQGVQGGLIAEVVAIHVADGNGEHLALAAAVGEGRVHAFYPDLDRLRSEEHT